MLVLLITKGLGKYKGISTVIITNTPLNLTKISILDSKQKISLMLIVD